MHFALTYQKTLINKLHGIDIGREETEYSATIAKQEIYLLLEFLSLENMKSNLAV